MIARLAASAAFLVSCAEPSCPPGEPGCPAGDADADTDVDADADTDVDADTDADTDEGVIVMDFDSVDATAGNVDAFKYLGDHGISYGLSGGTTIEIVNDANLYDGQAANSTSRPNLLTQIGSNDPVEFYLLLPRGFSSVTFRRAELEPRSDGTGIIHPPWNARAYDAEGFEVDSVSEAQTRSYGVVPTADFSLTGVIERLAFFSDNEHIAAFSAVLLDDLVLTP